MGFSKADIYIPLSLNLPCLIIMVDKYNRTIRVHESALFVALNKREAELVFFYFNFSFFFISSRRRHRSLLFQDGDEISLPFSAPR